MSDLIISQLEKAENASLVAPAGYGKTEVIARAVALTDNGRTLLLTHTHAGVRSMKDRLKKLHIPSSSYKVDTIASWALKLSVSYPKLSGASIDQPVGEEWKEVYQYALIALSHKNIRYLITHSYTGIYVDEYQDCTKSQHKLIMALAKLLPVRVLGDPLQGIFGFDDDPLIDWDRDVLPNFEPLEQLQIPWRWENTNQELGKWLGATRECLLHGKEIDFRTAPSKARVYWKPHKDIGDERKACYKASAYSGNVVAIHKWPPQAHKLASQLGGVYSSMEEIECRDLLSWARKLDGSKDYKICLTLIEGASKCWTGLKTELTSVINALRNGKPPKSRKYPNINQAMNKIVATPGDSGLLLPAMIQCETAGKKLYRRELWEEMINVLKYFESGTFDTFEDVAWNIRNRTRIRGRRLNSRMVSRALLIKGLEFDHVVIANADILDDPQNLYVALTRCKCSLTVLSQSPIIVRPPFKTNF